jgi:hypothetical protein
MKKLNFLIAILSFISLGIFAQKPNGSPLSTTTLNCNTSITSNIEGRTLLCDTVMHGFSKYKIGKTSGISSYDWELPQGMMIVSGQGTNSIMVSIDYSFSGGDVKVSGSTICGTRTSSRSLYVSIVPEAPVFETYREDIRMDEEYEFSVEDMGNVNYMWTVPFGAVILEGEGSSRIRVKFSESFVGGDIEVYAENSCAAGESSIITLNTSTSDMLYDNENTVTENNELLLSSELIKVEHSRVYNYPNPVNSTTRFHVELGEGFSQTENIEINIFDIKGQKVKSIRITDNNGDGSFNQNWNAMDESGNSLAAGLYFYNVIAQDNNGKLHSISANSNIQIVR